MTELLKKLHKENQEMKRNQGKIYFILTRFLLLILKPGLMRSMSM